MDNTYLKEIICRIAPAYQIKRVTLFGSRAAGTNRVDSDVDLIIEFYIPVSILTLSQLRCELEEKLGVEVDVVHGPLRPTDMIDIDKTVELYAA